MTERANLRQLLQTAQTGTPEQADIEDVTGKPQQPAKRKQTARPTAAPKTRGKSSNPDYEPVKVLVKKDYRDSAFIKWQREHGRKLDFSDLIEKLLSDYISA